MRIAVHTTATTPLLPEALALTASIARTWRDVDIHVLATRGAADASLVGTVTDVDRIDDTGYRVPEILGESDQVALLTPRHIAALFDDGYDVVVHVALRHVAVGPADSLVALAIDRGFAVAVPSPVAAAFSLTPEVALIEGYRGRNVGAVAITAARVDVVTQWDRAVVDTVLDVQQRSVEWASSVFLDSLPGRYGGGVEGTASILDWGDYAAVASDRARGPKDAALLDCSDLFGSMRHALVTETEWTMPRGVTGLTPVAPVIEGIESAFAASDLTAVETPYQRFRAAVRRSIDPTGRRFGSSATDDIDDWLYSTSSSGCTRAADLVVLADAALHRRFPGTRFDPAPFAEWVQQGGRERLGFDPFDRSYPSKQAPPEGDTAPTGFVNALRWRWNHARVLVPGHLERVERAAHRRFVGRDPRERRGIHPPRAVPAERDPQLWAPNRDSSLNIVGPFRSESGLGMAARAGLDAVRSLGIPFNHVDVTDAYPSRNSLDVGLDDSTRGQWGDVNLLHINADEMLSMSGTTYRHRFGGRFNAAMWFWETADLPRRSQGSLNIVDELWVASRYLADVFGQYGKVPVRVVGLAADLPDPRPVDRSTFGWRDDELVFLFVTDALSSFGRKNPVPAMEAFVASFGPKFDGVRFVLKISNLSVFPDHHRDVHELADRHDAVTIIDDYLPRDRVLDLMAAADVYVSLHAAEGYGLTLLEAMAMGTPTICTGYSGNMDFTTAANSWLVDFDMMETTAASGPYPAGSVWARPRIDHVVEIMRAVAADPDQIALRSPLAQADAVSAASLDTFAARLHEQLRRVL